MASCAFLLQSAGDVRAHATDRLSCGFLVLGILFVNVEGLLYLINGIVFGEEPGTDGFGWDSFSMSGDMGCYVVVDCPLLGCELSEQFLRVADLGHLLPIVMRRKNNLLLRRLHH